MIELKSYYCYNDEGKEVLWGRVIDLKTVSTQKCAIIYVSKNELGNKVIVFPIFHVEKFLNNGTIWLKRKRK